MLSILKSRKTYGAVVLSFALSAASAAALDLDQARPDPAKANEAERKPGQLTADDQSNRRSDLEVTQNIRQLIVDDKSLSTAAHNVKVITKRGKVTLKGPVSSQDEKTTIGTMAAQVVGASNVSNQLTVKPAKEDKKPATVKKDSE